MSTKNIVVAFALASIGLSAHAEGMYGTLGVGSASNWGTGFSLSAGMSNLTALPFGKQKVPVAAEVGYVNFGSKDYYGISAKASAFYGAAVGTFDLKNKLSANVKLGLTSVSVEACSPPGFIPASCASGSSTGLLFGAGVQYDLGNNLSAGADYRDFDGEGFLGINASMKF